MMPWRDLQQCVGLIPGSSICQPSTISTSPRNSLSRSPRASLFSLVVRQVLSSHQSQTFTKCTAQSKSCVHLPRHRLRWLGTLTRLSRTLGYRFRISARLKRGNGRLPSWDQVRCGSESVVTARWTESALHQLSGEALGHAVPTWPPMPFPSEFRRATGASDRLL